LTRTNLIVAKYAFLRVPIWLTKYAFWRVTIWLF